MAEAHLICATFEPTIGCRYLGRDGVLNSEARNVVENAVPSGTLTFIVSVHLDSSVASSSRAADARTRDAVDRARTQAKLRHIERFARYRKLGIRVVNALGSTPQFIVTGPAHAWQKLFREQAEPVVDPEVEMTPDDPEWTMEPDLGPYPGL